ncbi:MULTISPECIES: hypothetical protein [Rhodococcus]|uniref:hypothetical protein n=1 Tax=Rhodococcus TaxID=1827 RepID=UPI0003024AFB|nr:MULTISPECIES: hypothetical protein [Rhodococcus]
MSTATTTAAAPDTVLAGHLDHVATLGLSGRAVRGRARVAGAFLAEHLDLRDWMTRPAGDQLTELRSTGAWPLLCHLIGGDEARLDLEFAAVKNLTGLGRAVENRDPGGFAAVRTAGPALGAAPSTTSTPPWLPHNLFRPIPPSSRRALPQPDRGSAADAVSGPHRRQPTTAPAAGITPSLATAVEGYCS